LENTKGFNVSLINEVYLIEKNFESICEESRKLLSEMEKINDRINKLEQRKPDDVEILDIKKGIEDVAKKLFETNKEIEEIKEGEQTLFDWKIMDKKTLDIFVEQITSSEFKVWLMNKIEKDEKLIFSEIDLNGIESIWEMGGSDYKLKIIDALKLEKYSVIYMILNSPFNIKGKENATIYFPKLKHRDEFISRCSVTDIISTKLLNTSEEFDLDVLNNLKDNNVLSKLYELASEEAKRKSFNLVNKNLINSLTKSINNYFIKKNLE